MSLLLDALKKAAEQKAAKAREKKAESEAMDDTALESPGDDTGATLAVEDDSLPRHRLEDETELNQTELQTQLQTQFDSTVADREDDTRTAVDEREETRTELQNRSEQMQTGEDQTIVFDERDITEFMDEPPRGLGSQPSTVDRTEYDPPAGEDSTVYDETAFTNAEQDVTGTEQTDISELTQVEDTAFIAEPASSGDDSNVSVPSPGAGPVDQGEPEAPPDTDPTTIDDDMSLLLVERDQTSFTSPTAITDPQRPQDHFNALRGEDTVSNDTSLADTTARQSDGVTRTKSSDTATTGIAERTETKPGPAVPRPDATGTYTYAPDNYDRTLMRLPNDDASRLFAGMKSESDVVMTPDYAKQVFRSKSSAKRAQNFKIYGGITIAVLLAIGVYSILEYQSELEVIDTSLRPLKRDPMPGIVRPGSDEQAGALAEGQIDERTIQLIQNAEIETDPEPVVEEPAVDSGVIAEITNPAVSDPEAESRAEVSPPVEAAEGETAVAQAAAETIERAPQEAGVGEPDARAAPAFSNTEPRAETANLQIQTGNRVQRKQVLLREAYEAYQAGNDTLALERYNQVLALDSNNRYALLGRAAIKVQNGESAAAISDYRTLLLANPKDSLALASLLTVTNFSPQEAETQLKLMIRDEPDSPYLNFALANAYGAQDRWQEAQGHYFKALQHNPGDPNYAYNLAVSLEHISQPKAAISYYRRALENYNKGLATFNREVVDRRLEILEKQ